MLETFATPYKPDRLLTRLQSPEANAELDRGLLLQVLDEVDYGMLLVDAAGRILHANHLARHELARTSAVQASESTLTAVLPSQSDSLNLAIRRACQGHRVLLDLGSGSKQLSVAFVPLAHPLEGERDRALVVFGRRDMCQALTLRFFARCHGLTPAEEQVLREICSGEKAESIACKLGVGLATVRTQVSSIRRKTRTATLRQLLKLIALLPPLVPALRPG